MDRSVLRACIFGLALTMISCSSYADPPRRPIVYVFDDATATFGPPGNPFSAVIGIDGIFEVDPNTQTIVAMNIQLSNLPTVISYYDVPYTAAGVSVGSGYAFYTVASNGNNGLEIAFTAPLDNKQPAPLYEVVLWPQQWGETPTLKVTGAADPIQPFGQPGFDNCHAQSIAGLVQTYGGLKAAAAALGYPNTKALDDTIIAFCGG
jgi:hypothetical protein